jgi:diaminohydroxyphosphoribosylaminopyrimidine deaminase/5-amino-6-(5-phosphoribosylamino)uracil reductase
MKRAKTEDERYLLRCIDLASEGEGFVSPNPMVGCVIVRSGRTVGEGYHARFGGPHAEIAALRIAGRRARNATLYVNLEPCSHHGKTPPCVDAIIDAGIKKVVVCSTDPNPLVAGRGVRRLRRSGIQVSTGTLCKESERLNERFFTFMKTGLPFVGMKAAQTLDGRVTDFRGTSKWITSELAQKEAHRLRSSYDAILVGANTVSRDNPQLTVRRVKGRNPLRVVLDPRLRLTPRAALFDTRRAGTLIFTSARAMSKRKSSVAKLSQRGVYILGLDKGSPLDLRVILRTLAALGVSSVLVEGGPYTMGEFVQQKLVNRLHWFVAPKLLGEGLHTLTLKPPVSLKSSIVLRDATVRTVGKDFLIEGLLCYH